MTSIIKQYQRQQVSRAVGPVQTRAAQTSLGALGQGMTAVAGAFDEAQDVVDTAAAKDADTNFSEIIRQELYADETGFMYSKGGDAVSRRKSVADRLNAAQEKIYGGLSGAARAKASNSIMARYQRTLQQIDQHTSGQRNVYLDDASNARISSTVQNAILDPSDLGQSIKTAYGEIDDLAGRNGWAPEVTALKKKDALNGIHAGVIGRLETADPQAALDYLRDNKDSMHGTEVSKWESALIPKAREFRGRRAGRAAASQRVNLSSFNWSKYAVGGAAARSDSFTGLDQEYASRVAQMLQAADAELGDGALKITSAYRSVEKQRELFNAAVKKYGSVAKARKWVAPPGKSRHNSGTAVDFAGANGGLLRDANSKEAKWIKANAARFGLDVPMEWEPWQVELSGSRGGAKTEPEPFLGGGMDSLLTIENPDERAVAIREYNMVIAAEKAEFETNRAFAERTAEEIINNGGNVFDLPSDFRQYVGHKAIESLANYQEILAAGRKVVTDNQTYVDLSEMAAKDPEEFLKTDPMEWKDKLDQGDFEYFTKLRSSMMAGTPTKTRAPVSGATLRASATTSLKAAGIDDPEAKARFETGLLRWANENPEDARDPFKVNQQVNIMLAEVTIPNATDKSWMPFTKGKTTAPAFEITLGDETPDPEDDVTPEMIRDGGLKINGSKVSNQTIENFAQLYFERYGHPPTVRDMVDAMISAGITE